MSPQLETTGASSGAPPTDAPIDFDAYAKSYSDHLAKSITFCGQSHRFYVQAKVDHILRTLPMLGIDPARARALDVGCGTGETDVLLAGKVGELHGIDISEESVSLARQRPETQQVRYTSYDGLTLPYETGSFDFAFAITVVHHVPPQQWPAFFRELARVVRPGGLVAIYEHNPWNPLTRRVVNNCEFDRDAVLLTSRTTRKLMAGAGMSTALNDYILFFPWKNGLTGTIERMIGRTVPLGAQYATYGRVPAPR